MIYPPAIKTYKGRIAYRIFKVLYTFNQGKGSVLGRITGFLPEVGIVLIALKYFGIYEPKFWQVVIGCSIGVVFCWAIGKVYLHYNCDRIDSMVGHERNPILKEVHEAIVKNKGRKL